MTRLPLIATALAVALTVGCKRPSIGERIANLPEMPEDYRVDTYIGVASDLQALGPNAGSAALLSAATNSPPSLAVFVLCRMVFTNAPGGNFRRAMIGAFDFVGGTSYSDWPLEPIELVDGVPFVVATRWSLSGQMEPPDAYVRHCISACSWSATRFGARTMGQKRAALAKLAACGKWKTPLTKWDMDYLAAQLR